MSYFRQEGNKKCCKLVGSLLALTEGSRVGILGAKGEGKGPGLVAKAKREDGMCDDSGLKRISLSSSSSPLLLLRAQGSDRICEEREKEREECLDGLSVQ